MIIYQRYTQYYSQFSAVEKKVELFENNFFQLFIFLFQWKIKKSVIAHSKQFYFTESGTDGAPKCSTP